MGSIGANVIIFLQTRQNYRTIKVNYHVIVYPCPLINRATIGDLRALPHLTNLLEKNQIIMARFSRKSLSLHIHI